MLERYEPREVDARRRRAASCCSGRCSRFDGGVDARRRSRRRSASRARSRAWACSRRSPRRRSSRAPTPTTATRTASPAARSWSTDPAQPDVHAPRPLRLEGREGQRRAPGRRRAERGPRRQQPACFPEADGSAELDAEDFDELVDVHAAARPAGAPRHRRPAGAARRGAVHADRLRELPRARRDAPATTIRSSSCATRRSIRTRDLLLHDMGQDLADGSGTAQASEWRTPPLWGLGLLRDGERPRPAAARRPRAHARSRPCSGTAARRRSRAPAVHRSSARTIATRCSHSCARCDADTRGLRTPPLPPSPCRAGSRVRAARGMQRSRLERGAGFVVPGAPVRPDAPGRDRRSARGQRQRCSRLGRDCRHRRTADGPGEPRRAPRRHPPPQQHRVRQHGPRSARRDEARRGARFIADEKALGFDNIADALGMTDAQYEQYFNAADALAEQAFADAALRGADRDLHAGGGRTTRACTRTIIARFGTRAWRRPLADRRGRRGCRSSPRDARALGEDFDGLDQAGGQGAARRRCSSCTASSSTRTRRRPPPHPLDALRAGLAALVPAVEHDARRHAVRAGRERRAARRRRRCARSSTACSPIRARQQLRRELRRPVARPARAAEPSGRADRLPGLGRARCATR